MRRSLILGTLLACICVLGIAVLAQTSERAYTVNWYAGGTLSALMNVKIHTSLETTGVTFYEQGDRDLRYAQRFNLEGKEAAIYTANGSFALFTSNPGVNLYLFRRKGTTVIKALECHGPYQPEIGNGWVMCFAGRTESQHNIYPSSATIYLSGPDETFNSAATVEYKARYTHLAQLIGNR
jgi:hypothetical protein